MQLILERLGDGAPDEDLLKSYPTLRSQHIRAAQAYAAAVLGSDEVLFPSEATA